MKNIDDLTIIRRRFFNYRIYFNNFSDINDEKIKAIKQKVKELNNIYNIDDLKKTNILEAYKIILYHLLYNSNIRFDDFDEKVIFVILAMDEKLVILNKYLAANIISIKQIKEATNIHEEVELKFKRKAQIKKYTEDVRNSLGFFENDLLTYEYQFYKKFLVQKKFIQEVNIDYSKKLFDAIIYFKNFNSITKDEFNEVKEKALKYIQNNKDINYTTVIYHLLYQNDILKLKDYKQQFLFLILVIDPELKLLEIYEEECTWKNIEERAKSELNFFDENIIKLEKKFKEKFFNN